MVMVLLQLVLCEFFDGQCKEHCERGPYDLW
jgi:hypothetical protein